MSTMILIPHNTLPNTASKFRRIFVFDGILHVRIKTSERSAVFLFRPNFYDVEQ